MCYMWAIGVLSVGYRCVICVTLDVLFVTGQVWHGWAVGPGSGVSGQLWH